MSNSSAIQPDGGALDVTVSPANWSGVFAMSLCVFALIASEFMPVSLLTPMAASLGVSEGWTGYGIAISGAFAVITSLSISALSGRADRKTVLLALTGVMALSGAIVALATSYAAYMVGRALIGVVIGGFWSLSAAIAMRLVPAEQVPRAMSVLMGGNALATVVAAPLSSYLGAAVGWRGAFLALVPVAAVAFAWQWISLPTMRDEARPHSGNLSGLLRRWPVVLGMLASGAFFMGQFTLFTYVRPFLESVTHVSASALTLMLLGIGVSGVLGTALVGKILKRNLYGVLIGISISMAVIAVLLVLFSPWSWPVAALLAGWGLLATSAPVGWWTWIAKALPTEAEAGGGLMVAVIQFSIAFGSTVGGALFDHLGYQSAFLASALILVSSACVTARVAGVLPEQGR